MFARCQPHSIIQGRNGSFEWLTDRAWDHTAIRVEADGYISAIHMWITKRKVDQDITIKLEKDPGVEGEVRLPNGTVAEGASESLALPPREISVHGPKLASDGLKSQTA